jgi:hypothetical protein
MFFNFKSSSLKVNTFFAQKNSQNVVDEVDNLTPFSN